MRAGYQPVMDRLRVAQPSAFRDLNRVDITDQVKTEAALRESEAKFRTIANAMPQMVWSTLPDGFHDYYNQQDRNR